MDFFLFTMLALSAAASAQSTTTLTETQNSTLTQTVFVTNAAASTGSSSWSTNSTTNTTNTTSSASLSAAQTTISLFTACAHHCHNDTFTFFGGIVSANPTATVITIDCVASANQTACDTTAVTVTQGPSIYQRTFTEEPLGVMSISCDISSSTSQAVCVEAYQFTGMSAAAAASTTVNATATAASPTGNGTAANASTTLSFGSNAIHYSQLVITSGIEMLSSAPAPYPSSNSSSSPSKTSSSSSATKAPVGPTVEPFLPNKKGAATTTFVGSSSLALIVAFAFAIFCA